jgi:hypothetical protein
MKKKSTIYYTICSPSEYALLIGKSTRWVQMQCNDYLSGATSGLPGVSGIIRNGKGRFSMLMTPDHLLRIKKYKSGKKLANG